MKLALLFLIAILLALCSACGRAMPLAPSGPCTAARATYTDTVYIVMVVGSTSGKPVAAIIYECPS